MPNVQPLPTTFEIANAFKRDPIIAEWLAAKSVSLRSEYYRDLERDVNQALYLARRSLPSLPPSVIHDMVLSNGKIVLVGGVITDQGQSSVVNGIEEYPVRFSDGKHDVTFSTDALRAMLAGATYDAPKSVHSVKNGAYTLHMNTRLPYSDSADWWVLDDISARPVNGRHTSLRVEGVGEWVRMSLIGDTRRCEISPAQGAGWKVRIFEQMSTYEQPVSSFVVADRLGAMDYALKQMGSDWSFKKRTEYWMYEYDTETGDTGALLGRFPHKNLYGRARAAIEDTGKPVVIKKVQLNGFTVKESATEQVYRK